MRISRNFVCLTALAVVGEGILIFSFSSNTASDIVGIVSAVLISMAAAMLFKFIADFYSKKQFCHKEIISCIISFAFCIVMVLGALETCFVFSKYASDVMLQKDWTILPFAVLLILAALTAASKKRVILKLGLVLFCVSAVFILLIFFFSLPFMSIKYLIPYKDFSFKDSVIIFKDFSISLLPVILPALVIGKEEKKTSFAVGFAFGGAILLLCFVNTLAVFGTEFASTLVYPYPSAVSTAEFGELFYRMDGFLYAVSFFSCALKVSAFLTATFMLLKGVLSKIILKKF